MTQQEMVSGFVRGRAPAPVCDSCVADHLALSRRQVTAARAKAVADAQFRRFTGRCSGCCTDRRVTTIDWG